MSHSGPRQFQIENPKELREKLDLSPKQRLHVVEKGGIITLVPEVPLVLLKGALKGDVQGGPAGEKELIVKVVLRALFRVISCRAWIVGGAVGGDSG